MTLLRLFGAALLSVGLLAIAPDAAAQDLPDTVFLKDGGRVRGTIMVDDSKGVQILLPDQSTRTYARGEIERIDYAEAQEEPSPDPEPEPEPAAAPPPAPPPLSDFPRTFDDQPRGETEGIKGLYITGLVVFGVFWLGSIPAAAGISSATGSEMPEAHAGIMAVPLAGPIIEAVGGIEDATTAGAPGFIAIEVLQVSGLIMTICGFAIRRPVHGQAEHVPTFAVAPIGEEGWGLHTAGSF
jgi:hypothetical protein